MDIDCFSRRLRAKELCEREHAIENKYKVTRYSVCMQLFYFSSLPRIGGLSVSPTLCAPSLGNYVLSSPNTAPTKPSLTHEHGGTTSCQYEQCHWDRCPLHVYVQPTRRPAFRFSLRDVLRSLYEQYILLFTIENKCITCSNNYISCFVLFSVLFCY